jgi:transposase-like protein
MGPGRPKRQRRSFTDEFKAEVVRKVVSSGALAASVARRGSWT